jgi:hypothetical protein
MCGFARRQLPLRSAHNLRHLCRLSALPLVFRETIGGKMTKYDSPITPSPSCRRASSSPPTGSIYWRSTQCRRPPPGVQPAPSWRPHFPVCGENPGRRWAATDEPVPGYIWLLLFLQFLAGVYLSLNAAGWPTESRLASFALDITIMLFTAEIAYLIALGRALRGPA